MIIYKSIGDIQKRIEELKNKNLSIGFVPTMGALHSGHLALVKNAKTKSDIVVCSIYVNPSQFNDKSDLEKYPRTLSQDIEGLTKEGVDILFLPDDETMYPDGNDVLQRFDIGRLEFFLEGERRPGHFQGVCNVVNRFLQIITPDYLFLGQKDFQQVKVIERLLEISNQNKIEIVVEPIIREVDGLAMSSRNVRLTQTDRQRAHLIYGTLKWMKENFGKIQLQQLKEQAIQQLKEIPNAETDYLEICTAKNLETAFDTNLSDTLIALVVVKISGVRLLDNIILN